MLENSKGRTVIEDLCKKLHFSELAEDVERVNHARILLAQLQQNDTLRKLHSNTKTKNVPNYATLKISDLLLETKQRLNTLPLELNCSGSRGSEKSVRTLEDSDFSKEEYEMESSLECEDSPNDKWLGFFHGYDMLQEHQACILSENKQCIELSLKDDCCSLESYLRQGIRCFMLNLSLGSDLEKQTLIFHLRECELKISKEYGFSFNTTLIALLSPRLQYTGVMAAEKPMENLEKGNIIILSTKRKYSASCTSSKIYINAHFLLGDCKRGDFILVGPSIQLTITHVLRDELKCVVAEPGLLSSRLPVLFPARCHRSQVSLEELEDITFAREVGINVLVSYKPGTPQYLKDLNEIFDLLKFDNLRLFTRLPLKEYGDGVIDDIKWIVECYEGFLVEIGCNTEDDSPFQSPSILELTPTSANLMATVFQLKKPIILNSSLIAERRLYVQPHNVPHIFQLPDKFLFSNESFKNAFSFFLLQNALTKDMFKLGLPIHIFSDMSEATEDGLAAACVAASRQSQIKAIVVCSAWPDTAIELSHFRSEVPVILVSPTKSLGDYISLYHHLIFMHFQARSERKHAEFVIRAFMFSLIYLKTKQILCDGQSVLLVYGTNNGNQFCDNHLIFKFNEHNFASSLEDILFR